MSKINGIYQGKTKTQFTGFKVAVKIEDKYYSPVTGIEYKPGLVTIPEVQVNYTTGFPNDLLNEFARHHEWRYKGLTAVFQNLDGAVYLKKDITLKSHYYNKAKLVILKMTVQVCERNPELYNGNYNEDSTVLGGRIRCFKEIKE